MRAPITRVAASSCRAKRLAVSVLAACTLGACVTINIYFPAAAAERAADRIIDEVWQLKPETAKPASGDTALPK